MKRGQKITIIVSLCVLSVVSAVITFPLVVGRQIAKQEVNPAIRVARNVVDSPEHEKARRPDPKVWEGFRELKFGVHVQDIKPFRFPEGPYSLQEESGDKRVKAYAKLGDGPSIGNAEPVEVFYFFYKEQFYSVVVTCKGLGNFKALFEAVTTYYGEGKKDVETAEQLSWVWSRDITNGLVYATLIYKAEESTTSFLLFYGPIWDQQKADDHEKVISGQDF